VQNLSRTRSRILSRRVAFPSFLFLFLWEGYHASSPDTLPEILPTHFPGHFPTEVGGYLLSRDNTVTFPLLAVVSAGDFVREHRGMAVLLLQPWFFR